MAAPEFCTIQDINDLLGKKSVTPEEYYIVASGTIEPAAVTRLIQRRSLILNEEHSMNFNSTSYTEYYDTNGIPRIEVDHYPILSITSLALWNGSSYEAKTEGNNRNDDDYYIENDEAGFVGFWNNPAAGKRYVLLVYDAGYTTIPSYVEEACAKMVAVDVALSQAFATVCAKAPEKWHKLIVDWLESIEFLLNEFIRVHPLSIKTIGKWRSDSFVEQLELMTGNFSD